MAKHHHRHHYHHRGHNPFGISKGILVDAGYNSAGALAALWLGQLIPSLSSGWAGVAATAGGAVVASFAGRFIGGARATEEILKGGLTATIIKALHTAGIASNIGLGLYANSWFAVPTSSDPYGRTYAGNLSAPPVMALPPAAVAGKLKGLGMQPRYRSRYM